ncbi:MAG: PTS system, fructose-specific IIA component / PTS system, fructose-specific IIB component / PTS system, fructose-specific IIC component, partial [uncultured Rubrobacteraceae bacterium]
GPVRRAGARRNGLALAGVRRHPAGAPRRHLRDRAHRQLAALPARHSHRHRRQRDPRYRGEGHREGHKGRGRHSLL